MEAHTLRELDFLAVEASENQSKLNELIGMQELYIIRCASEVTHHYITKSDDEWSIALLAFDEAVHNYQLEKGSFLSFAKLVIRRRVVDYLRTQGKYNMEITVDPVVFDTDSTENDEDVSIRLAVAERVSVEEKKDLKYEIAAANEIFSSYGFSFMDLSDCSPRAQKTKKSCAIAVGYVLKHPLMITELRNTSLLPIKTIEKNTLVPRKIIERHRKYIIAAIEILSGEYPNLAEYLRYIREEMQ